MIIDVFDARFPAVVALEQISKSWSVDNGEPQLHPLLFDVLDRMSYIISYDIVQVARTHL